MPDNAWPSMRDTKAHVVVGYGTEKQLLIEYLRTIPEVDWSRPSLHPEWDVRGVVSHLWGQAQDFLDKQVRKATVRASKQGADAIVPLMIEANKRHIEEGSKMSVRELIAQCEYVRSIVAVRLSQIPGPFWPLMRIKGVIPMRLYHAMGIILMDAWVYRQDIQRSRGDIDRNGPFEVLLPTSFFGVARMRAYNPPAPVNLDVGAHGQWSLVPALGFARGYSDDAPATVRIEADEFLMVASGRTDPDAAQAQIEGDQGLGKEFLYSIRYMGLVPGMQ